MSSPVRHLPSSGPPSSYLQKLLQEINDREAEPSSRDFRTPKDRSSPKDSTSMSRAGSLGSSMQQSRRSSSVWVNGGSMAEDARQKLRLLDEAHQKQQSFDSSPYYGSANSPKVLSKPQSPTMFTDMHFDRSVTFPVPGLVSPPSDDLRVYFDGKRARSDCSTPDLVTKKLRQDSFSDMACRDRDCCLLTTTRYPKAAYNGSTVSRYTRSPALSDSALCRDERPGSIPSPSSELQNAPIHAYKASLPVKPCLATTPDDGSNSPNSTPPWMQPLHLFDDDVSYYKTVHGHESQGHPLCLWCFRQHGSLHKILTHGCEVCGRGEALEGHYWDTLV